MAILHSARLAVGWLHPDHAFTRGAVPPDFIAKLSGFVRRWGDSVASLNWGLSGGFHECEFCHRYSHSGSFGVPAGERVFCAPTMIAHYVEKHGYAPPVEFVRAVLSSPLPGTPQYDIAVAQFRNR